MQVVQFGAAPAELARVRCCMLASKLQKAMKPFILRLSLEFCEFLGFHAAIRKIVQSLSKLSVLQGYGCLALGGAMGSTKPNLKRMQSEHQRIAPSEILQNVFFTWEKRTMRLLLQDCKEVPIFGSCQRSSRRGFVSFSIFLLSSGCSHDVSWGVGWRAMSVSGVKYLFLDFKMFDDVWSEPRVAHGRFGWHSGMKTARQIHANFRSSKGNSSHFFASHSEIWMYPFLQESVLLRLSELFLRKRGTLVFGRMFWIGV